MQTSVRFQSKVMAVFALHLWCHLWQTFRTESLSKITNRLEIIVDFLYNFPLSRNTRFLISGQVFNQSLWKLVQMENDSFKRLKLQSFFKILCERCETAAHVWRHFPPKVLQNSFKVIYCNQTIRETSTIPAIDIFKWTNPSIEG